MEIRNQLTAAEYWEWRQTISDVELAKHKMQNATLELKLMQKEAEMIAIKQQLFRLTKVSAIQESLKAAQKEYDRYKLAIENKVGQSLSNKMIDDFTFEIKPLPEDPTILQPNKAKE
jgi:hypothetical protein